MRGSTASAGVVGYLPPDHVRVAARLISNCLRWLCIAAAIVILGGISLASLFGYRIMVVTSGSMVPQFGAGDALVVRLTDPATIRVGDVVTFRAATKGMTTHRVLGIRSISGQTWFQTKGDANATPDPDLRPASSVYGRQVLSLGGVGRFLYLAVTPWGKLAMLGYPALYLLVQEARYLLSRRRRPLEDASLPAEEPREEPGDRLIDLTSELEVRVVRDSVEAEDLRARLAETEAELARQAARLAAVEAALAERGERLVA
jgi:signal peptidase